MASPAAPLKIASTIRLNATGGGGAGIPLLGFGVYQSTDALTACRAAFETGYRHIDSARAYRNEEDVKQAVHNSGLDRKSLWLTTKVMSGEHGYGPCAKAVDSSVDRLGSYWDLILLHAPTAGKAKRLEAYQALADAQKEGKARAIGVSNFGIHHLEELEAANVGPTPAINQIELHPWCQQRPIVDYCKQKDIVVEAYCPLARGQHMDDPTLTSIANKTGKTPAQVLVRWSLQKGFVPLPKSDKPHRIMENADVYDFELGAEDIAKLDALDEGDAGAISWNPIHGD